MGSALYIALEREIPGLDSVSDGKMLSKAEKHLAEAAKRLGVRPLMDFFSISTDEAANLLGNDIVGMDIPAAKWFTAEQGLMTVDALLAETNSSVDLQAARDDLFECQRVLREAQKQGVRWHLAIDF
jgi:hypothetical protein